jgi:hypothetical protein
MPWFCARGHVRISCTVRPAGGAKPPRHGVVYVEREGVCQVCSEPVVRIARDAEEGVGWHYTPRSRWDKIKHEGLVPYRLGRTAAESQMKDLVFEMLGADAQGVYLWAQPFSGAKHAGNIVERAICHQTWRIVLLRVTFPLEDVIHLPLPFGHTGGFAAPAAGEEPWILHTNEPAVLLSRAVPPDRIQLVGDYDLGELLAVPDAPRNTASPTRVEEETEASP